MGRIKGPLQKAAEKDHEVVGDCGFPELANETLQYCYCWRTMRVPFQPRMESGSWFS